jgi:hypothetical protein
MTYEVKFCLVCGIVMLQSFLNGSHSSLRSDSLGLDLSGTGQSVGGGIGTGREENVNYIFEMSDDNEDALVNIVCVYTVTYR